MQIKPPLFLNFSDLLLILLVQVLKSSLNFHFMMNLILENLENLFGRFEHSSGDQFVDEILHDEFMIHSQF